MQLPPDLPQNNLCYHKYIYTYTNMSIKSAPPRKYRIFPAYLNSSGFLVPEGIYNETEIDLDEARAKSTAILVNASDFQSVQPTTAAPDINFIASNDVSFQNIPTIVSVKKLKINSAPASEIEALKFVGKVATQKITEARKDAKIVSYSQLDKIAPLKSKKWEDIAVIDFELPDPTYGLVYEGLKTFGYTAETTNVQPTSTK
jgi:DNA uptake protein ComE-like DNA-binding protein